MHPALSNLERGRAAGEARGVAMYVVCWTTGASEGRLRTGTFFLGQPNLSGLTTAPAFPRFYAIVAAPTNLCELALGQTPFGRCQGNCLNAALVLCDRPS